MNSPSPSQLEAQLRQAQKLEAVGLLAGGVAHDFNNLLAVIRGTAELLLMDASHVNTQARTDIEQIVRASDRAAGLTRQLLLFSRSEAVQPHPLALNDLVANLAKMLKRIIREDIILECHYAKDLPFVQGDPGMLEQVLVNLVMNARDAMPRGGTLHIQTEKVSLDAARAQANPQAREGEFVCLSVRDTGIGIAPEHLSRIFERFFTTKEPNKGSGLGLATVHGIVRQHRGWVEVSSRLGQGATFRIVLPVIPPPARAPAAAAPGAGLRGGHETILLVEDELPVRGITRRVLENFGYKVWEAACARDALGVWGRRQNEIALLLTDIVLPGGVNGQGLARRLRAQRPELDVIFMSGYNLEALTKETGFVPNAGVCFLRKPCPADVLLRTVRQCLDDLAPDVPAAVRALSLSPSEGERAGVRGNHAVMHRTNSSA